MAVVLAIEDDDAIQDLYTAALVDLGYTVRRGYGDAALAAAMRDPPDMILLDLMQPGEHGHYETFGEQALILLRRNDSTRDTPVLVVTAWAEKAQRALTLGADDALVKPFVLGALFAAVERAVGPPTAPAHP